MDLQLGLVLILTFILLAVIFIGGYALGHREGIATGKIIGYRRGRKAVSL
jgi:hypothetical protein